MDDFTWPDVDVTQLRIDQITIHDERTGERIAELGYGAPLTGETATIEFHGDGTFTVIED